MRMELVAAPGLRVDQAVGRACAGRGRRDRRARMRSGSARRCRSRWRTATVRAEFVAVEGARERLDADLASLVRGDAAGRGRRLGARAHGGVVAGVERAVPVRGRLSRRGADLADRAQGDDVRDDRRGDRGADDVAAGGHRRRAQLGLPLLLAARLGARARGAARRPATPRRRWRSATSCCASAPAIRRRSRSCTAIGGERRLTEFELPELPGLRGLQAGPGRQRRVRAVPARRLRRGRRGRVHRRRAPRQDRASGCGRAGGRSSSTSRRSGASPTTGSGRRAARSATTPTPR